MAETHTGEAYYDAGTINEQLDEYEVYEVDGKLYLNNEAGDSDDYVAFDGVAQLLGNFRDADMTDADLDAGEGALYVLTDGADPATFSLNFAFHDPESGSVVVNVIDSDLSA